MTYSEKEKELLKKYLSDEAISELENKEEDERENRKLDYQFNKMVMRERNKDFLF